jgi:aryl-alcohol dehydrogenase-like predicted oxidoreductase
MDFTKYVKLGRTGLLVSRLGIGAGYGISARAVERAFHEYGINYFYWNFGWRKGVSRAIKHLAKKYREKMVVAIQSYDHSGFLLKHTISKRLKKVGIDYADIMIFGWFNHPPGKWLLNVGRKLQDEGKVRFLGMSGHRRAAFSDLAKRVDNPIDVFMLRYNAANRGAEKDVFPFLPRENRPGMTTYTATRWSLLLKKRKMPKGENPLTAAECYRFVLSNPKVDLCLMGPASESQLLQGLHALEHGPLSEKEMARIRKIGDHVYGRGILL